MDNSDTEYKPRGRGASRAPGGGRYQAQRTLIRWNPELEARLLVVYDYVMKQQGYKIPYDIIAQHLDPEKATSGAIEQHISKVRKIHNEKCAGNPVPAPNRHSTRRGPLMSADASRVTKSRLPTRGRTRVASVLYADDNFDEDENVNLTVRNDTLLTGGVPGPFNRQINPAMSFGNSAQLGNGFLNPTSSTSMGQFGTSNNNQSNGFPNMEYSNICAQESLAGPGNSLTAFTSPFTQGVDPGHQYSNNFATGYGGGTVNTFNSNGFQGGLSSGFGSQTPGYRGPVQYNGFFPSEFQAGPMFTTPSTSNTNNIGNITDSTNPASYEGYQFLGGSSAAGTLIESSEVTSAEQNGGKNQVPLFSDSDSKALNLSTPTFPDNVHGHDVANFIMDGNLFESTDQGVEDFGNGSVVF